MIKICSIIERESLKAEIILCPAEAYILKGFRLTNLIFATEGMLENPKGGANLVRFLGFSGTVEKNT